MTSPTPDLTQGSPLPCRCGPEKTLERRILRGDFRSVAVIGTREYPRLELVIDFVLDLVPGVEVVSGGALGPDHVAEVVARVKGNPPPCIFPVTPEEWRKIGKHAGHLRNQKVIDRCQAVVAFWDLNSSGTNDSIEKAHRAGKPVLVYGPTGRLYRPQKALPAGFAPPKTRLTEECPMHGESR